MIQKRNVGVCILLSLITCGIYGLYWFICLTDDANTVTGQGGTSGGVALLLSIVTCGIYGLYWMFVQGQKIDDAKVARGYASGSNGILYLILGIFSLGIVSYALMQNELNKLA